AMQLQRRVFATLKRMLSWVSNDPWLLHKLVSPVARLLSHLPGRWGDFWDQISIYMNKEALADEAVSQFNMRLAELDEASVCLDLGANVGHFTEKLANTGAQVHAFEPDPWAFEQLKTRMAGRSNVTLHNAAIGARAGTIEMRRPERYEDDPKAGSVGVTMLVNKNVANGSSFEVELACFTDFVMSLDQDIALIKMDIEGAEVDLLEALVNSPARERIKNMFVETHYNIYPEQAVRIASLKKQYGALGAPYVNFNWP
ncbi:MAG: FkbM family methyltransferase, partial [Pseudomonadota bacterium]